MTCECRLAIVESATHLFAEPGTLEVAGDLAAEWLVRQLASAPPIEVSEACTPSMLAAAVSRSDTAASMRSWTCGNDEGRGEMALTDCELWRRRDPQARGVARRRERFG